MNINLHAVRDFVHQMQHPQADLEYRQSRNAAESYGYRDAHNSPELTPDHVAEHLDSTLPPRHSGAPTRGPGSVADLTDSAHRLADWADRRTQEIRDARTRI